MFEMLACIMQVQGWHLQIPNMVPLAAVWEGCRVSWRCYMGQVSHRLSNETAAAEVLDARVRRVSAKLLCVDHSIGAAAGTTATLTQKEPCAGNPAWAAWQEKDRRGL